MSIQTTPNYYGKLTAIEYEPKLKKWKCLCDCGNFCFLSSSTLSQIKSGSPGAIKSCGCVKRGLRSQLVGRVFESLTVISKDLLRTTKKKAYWNCLCSCGTMKSIRGDGLTNGTVVSCGCYIRSIHSQYVNLTNNIYGYWTVVSHNKRNECFCRCKCGIEKTVKVQSLTEKISKSCGCFKQETVSDNLRIEHRNRKIKRGLDPDVMVSTDRERDRKRILPLLKQIKARDNFTCQLCGATKCQIVSHHIEKVSDNYDLFETETNLITLCVDCHNKVHQYNFHGLTEPMLTRQLKDKIVLIYSKK